MPEVQLIRRWGSHDAGETVDVTQTEADWLCANNYASEDGSDDAARAGARAPGTEGADLRAGGDVSRGGGMQVVRGARGSDEAPMNRAGRIDGAPRPGGPVYLTPHEVEAKREQAQLAEKQRAEARKASEKGEPQPVVGQDEAGGDGNNTTVKAREEVKRGEAKSDAKDAPRAGGKAADAGKASGR